MNCKEFQTQLDQLESAAIPAVLSEHARGCPSCTAQLQAQACLDQSLAVLGRTTPKVDLGPRIMATLQKEGAPAPSNSPLENFLQLIFPDTLLKKSMAFALWILFFGILARETIFAPTPLHHPGPVWEMGILSLEPGRRAPEWSGKDSGIDLPSGRKVVLGAGSRVSLSLPGRADAVVENGSFIPNGAGLFLVSGMATLHVEKTSPTTPFTIGTPFAEVAVVGTRFLLDLRPTGLIVGVTEGRVHVIHSSGMRELGPGQSIKVGKDGFRPDLGTPETGVATGSAASAPARVDPGPTSGPSEEENPGK